MSREVTFYFPSDKCAESFMDWFSNFGEQEYWTSAEYFRNTYANRFAYDYNTNRVVGEDENSY